MSRGNQILIGILVLQIALAAVFLWPQAAPVAGGEPLFGPLEADQIAQVTIRDQTGGEIRLLKELGTWVLPDAGNFPCKEDAVPNLVSKLVALTADRLVTETRSSHGRLKVAVDDFESRVEFELSDGTRHVLFIGTAPSYGVAHVRADGQDQVYLVSDLSSMDANTGAATWIDTQYVSLAQDEIFAVTLQNGNGRFVFTKDTAGTWMMPELGVDETLNESAVTSLVSRVATVRMLRPLGTEVQEHYGLAVPGAVLTVRTRDAGGVTQTHTFDVGAKLVDENAYFCRWSGSPYYVLVAGYTVQEWVEGTRDGFLELPPTPTPQPAG
jgi:hypothetical protein